MVKFMSNIKQTKDGLVEKSTGRKIISPLDNKHGKLRVNFKGKIIDIPLYMSHENKQHSIKGKILFELKI